MDLNSHTPQFMIHAIKLIQVNTKLVFSILYLFLLSFICSPTARLSSVILCFKWLFMYGGSWKTTYFRLCCSLISTTLTTYSDMYMFITYVYYLWSWSINVFVCNGPCLSSHLISRDYWPDRLKDNRIDVLMSDQYGLYHATGPTGWRITRLMYWCLDSRHWYSDWLCKSNRLTCCTCSVFICDTLVHKH